LVPNEAVSGLRLFPSLKGTQTEEVSVALGLLVLVQAAPQANPILNFLPLILIFAIFYFLLFLPMQRQKKQQQKMLAGIQNGDSVVTTGGIIGAVTGIDGDTITLRVKPDNVRLQVARHAISAVISEEKK
jgi:preprotein translocase subunit YajC